MYLRQNLIIGFQPRRVPRLPFLKEVFDIKFWCSIASAVHSLTHVNKTLDAARRALEKKAS